MAREVAFLDADISAIEQLRAHLKDGVYAIVLSRDAPALAQIADGIKNHRDIEAIHIIAHGRPGRIEFAAGPVGADALDLHADDLAAIGRSLDGGEIRLWTCETASGAEGTAFLAALAGATGASVAASTGLVGAAGKGGTWELDVQTRSNHARSPLTAQGMEVYSGVMVSIGSWSNDTVTVLEQAAPAVLDSDVSISAWDDNPTGTFLQWAVASAHAGDQLTIATSWVSGTTTGIFVSGSNIYYRLSSETGGNLGTLIGTVNGSSNGVNGASLRIDLNSITVTGVTDDTVLTALARAFRFQNTSDNPPAGNRAVTFTADDAIAGSVTDNDIDVGITAVNDAPVVVSGATLNCTENGTASAISPAATVTDADSANFSTGTLTVSFTANGTTADQLTIQNQGTGDGQINVSGGTVSYNPVGGGVNASIGTFTGGTNGTNLVITLDTDATPEAVQALMRAILYSNSSESPSTNPRTVTFSVNDGDGTANGGTNIGTATATINVASVNDAPVLGGMGATLAYTENQAATVIDSAVTLTDPDSTDFNGGSLTVAFTANGTASDQLTILNEGTGAGQIGVSGSFITFANQTIGSFTGGTNGTNLVVTFSTSSATPAAIDRLIERIAFSNNSENPSTSPRTVTFTVNDGDGTANGGVATASGAATVNVTAVNDAPTALNFANTTTTIAENTSTATHVKVADIVVSDPDTQGTNTLSLSGADAASFEIVGTELFVKAGVTLDFETKPSYSVTVNVNDASVGGNPDASQSFTLNLTDVDELAPTVAITDDEPGTANIAGGDIVYTFQFSETVTGFDATDVVVANGTKGTFTAVDGDTYTLVVTPAAGFTGNITVDVGTGAAHDTAGNPSVAASQSVQAVDMVAPSVSSVEYGTHDGALAAGEPIELIITFSEAVTVANGTPTLALSGGGTATLTGGSGTNTLTFSYTPAAGQSTADLEVTGIALNGATIKDTAGNDADTAGAVANPTGTVEVETTAPTVSIVVDDAALIGGETSLVTFTFSEAPSNFSNDDVTVGNGTLSQILPTGDPLVFTAILTPNAGVENASNVITAGTNWTDAAGNPPAAPSNSNFYAIDTAASATISIDPVTADNIINAAEAGLTTVTITGTVGGDAQDGDTVTLTVNGETFTGTVSGTTFSIDVSGEHLAEDTNIHASITVSDTAGNVTTITANHAYQVDLEATAIIAVNNITADNIINAAEAGGPIAVTGTVGGDVQDGATVTLTVNGNIITGTVSGTSFSINVDAADLVLDTNVHASVSATDTAGNTATGTSNHAYQVDLTATATIAVNDITADNIINTAEAGGTVGVTGTVGGDANDGDAVTLTVNGNTYNGTVSGTSFSINVSGADLAAGSSIHASVAATDAANNPVAAENTKAYSVDTTADQGGNLAVSVPDSLIGDAEKTSVAFSIAGLDLDATATVTFTSSGGGSPVVLTGITSGGTANLSGLADGNITVTVSATDAAGNTATGAPGASVLDTVADQGSDLAVSVADGLINNAEKANVAFTVAGLDPDATATVTFTSSNGGSPIVLNGVTGSGTANLSGLADGDITVTISATDAAGNHADGAPSATVLDTEADGFVILDPITDDNVINATEATANVAITGFVGGDAKDGDGVTLTVNGESYTGTVSGNAFTINVKGSDLAADSDSTVDVSVAATDDLGNTTALTSSQAYTVDATVEAWIVINPITDDNIINAEEAGQTIPVTGQLGPDVADGTIVTLTIGVTNYTGEASGGTFSIDVPGSALALGSAVHASVTATDAFGNEATETADQAYIVDLSGTASITLDVVAGDDIINATEEAGLVTLTGTVGGDVQDGDLVTLTVHGSEYVGFVSGNSFSIDVLGTDLALDTNVHASVSTIDSSGNPATATADRPYTVDTTADQGGDLAVSVTDNLVGNAEKTSVAYTVAGLDLDATATVTFSDGKNSVVGVNGVADLSGLTDGPITATVSATDTAGNTATGAPGATVLDTTADSDLAVSIADILIGAAEKANVAYTVTGLDVGSTAIVTFTSSNGGPPIVLTGITSSGSVDLSSLADGNITVTISATDAAGNTAAGAPGATVLDTVADQGGDLAVSVTDNLVGSAEKTSVAYTVTGLDPDATATVTFTDGTNSVVGVNGVADLSALTDGPITATVSATDTAGNTADGAPGATVLDTTADESGDLAVSVADDLVGNAEKTTVAYTVTGLDADATATVTFSDGKNSVVGVNGVADLSGLTDGPITATVSATDAAGNTAAGASGATVLDTTADEGGDLAVSVTDNLVGAAEKANVAYTVAGLDLDATATVTFSDGKNSVVGVNGVADLSGLADGPITATVSATDTAGNTAAGASGATVLDTIADQGGDLAVSVADNLVNNTEKTSVAYTVTGLDLDATATVTFSDGKNSVVGVNGVADLSGLTDGPITATVSATDTAGNTAAGASGATVLDTTADAGGDLAVSVTDNLVGAAEKANVAYTVAGLDLDATATVTFSDGKNSVVGVNGVADLSGLADGPITATVSATDTAGNTAAGAPGATVLDTTATATITIGLVTADNTLSAAEAAGNVSITGTVSGDVENGDTITLTVNGQNFTGQALNGGFSIDVKGSDLAADADSTIDASVSATDAAGNTAVAQDTQTYLLALNQAPVITSNGGGTKAAISVPENGTAVTTVTATDPDVGTTLLYSLSGADAGKFQISSTGVLSFVAAPDFEIPGDVGADNVYDVVVQVSDGTLTDSQAIAVTVTNVSGNIPSDDNDNVLIGTDEEDTINGLGGNDLLRGKLGKDALDGGSGSDTVDYSDKTSSVVLTLNGSTNATAFVGGVAEDTVKNVENIIGGSGDDTLTGDGAANVLKGGAGKDVLDGGNGSDTADYSDKTSSVVLTLNGSTNATASVGGVVEDTVRNIENVIGGSANDTLTGDSKANVLSGGNGSDVLTGGAGADTLDGGAASDRASYQTAAAAVIASLTNALGNTGDAAGDTYISVESLTGSNFDDTLTGSDVTNSIIGGTGNDTVFGLGGNDSLFGQDGNDLLVGGSGADSLSGGNGGDRASYDTATAAVVASLTNPGVNTGDALGDTYNSVRELDRLGICRHPDRQYRHEQHHWRSRQRQGLRPGRQ